jgi:hypothetical protein
MAFEVFILCMIAAALAMFVVSVLQDAAHELARALARFRDRERGFPGDANALPTMERNARGDAFRK